jgi:hypothetical protein
MPSIDLGLPTYVTDLWWNYGFTEAKRRVTLQQVGADTADASNYYGAILAAMNAIGGETVPAVPAFGGTPTSRYLYSKMAPMELQAKGAISDWAYGRITVLSLISGSKVPDWASERNPILLLSAVGRIQDHSVQGHNTVLPLVAHGVMTNA